MNRLLRTVLPALLLTAAWVLLPSHRVAAQALSPRFGVGFNTLLSTADGIGLGFRGRASAPVNADLSLAVDLGFTGFILQGRDDATYIFDPQASVIVNLPYQPRQLGYLLFGVGAYVPTGDNAADAEGGPTLHLGIGWVHALKESSLFYEIDPALIIGEESVDLALPLRIGLIF